MAIEDERQRFERYGEVFSVIILDIDHFKSFNDRFGHQEGDRILKMVSATLNSSVRASDVVGRWGGEEFIVLCPHTAVDGAVASAATPARANRIGGCGSCRDRQFRCG